MDESGEHHSQQTDTRTENEIPHILTHRWVMKNENTWTQEGEHHTLGSVVGPEGGTAWGGGPGEGLPGEKCQMWVKGRQAAKHTAMCVPMQLFCTFCTCTPKPKMQLKNNNNNNIVNDYHHHCYYLTNNATICPTEVLDHCRAMDHFSNLVKPDFRMHKIKCIVLQGYEFY